MPVLYTAVWYASSDINHAVISFVYTAIGILAVTNHAVISFWHTQLLVTLTMI